MRREKLYWFVGLAIPGVLLAAFTAPRALRAQQAKPQPQAPATQNFDYDQGRPFFKAYSYPRVPPPSLTNSPKIDHLIQGNKLEYLTTRSN